MSMRVNCDFYYDKQDVLDTIDRLVKLYEGIEDYTRVAEINTDSIQEAIDILYEIVEEN